MAYDIEYDEIYSKLNPFQQEVYKECIQRKKAGLSLPLGSGKTILSLLLALHFTRNQKSSKILIVVSKTLLQSWKTEIEKFFGKDSDIIKYQIFQKDAVPKLSAWKLHDDTKMVLTTADVVGKAYKKTELRVHFVTQNYLLRTGIYENFYKHPDQPFLNHSTGEGILFSRSWGCLLIDEIQKYTNIETNWCQGLGAICAEYRRGLSGTMYEEPK